MKTYTLNTGRKIPVNGFGTWKADEGAVITALRAALDAGYRHIDCAAVYGNEKEVGVVFGEYFKGDNPKIARDRPIPCAPSVLMGVLRVTGMRR